METERMKSHRGWILATVVVLLLGAVGGLWWALAPDELTPAEEHARKFVEVAYIHPNPDRVRPLVDPELVEPGAYSGEGFPPGEVRIGSYMQGVDPKVVVVLPKKYGEFSYVEIGLKRKANGWTIYHEKMYPGKPSFEAIQQQPEYQRWGIETWKNADVH